MSKMQAKSLQRQGLVLVVGLTAASSMGGCSNAGQGAISGAALGAGLGAVVGSMYADAGKGALIGTAGGALLGGVIGDQNERNDRRARGELGYYTYERDCR